MQVLRLIKHVSNKGAPEYRRAICKQAKEIRRVETFLQAFLPVCALDSSPCPWIKILTLRVCRDLTHYRGEPDPFKGDVLNQKVRDAAKETLDAIFQATDTNYSASSSKPTLTVQHDCSYTM